MAVLIAPTRRRAQNSSDSGPLAIPWVGGHIAVWTRYHTHLMVLERAKKALGAGNLREPQFLGGRRRFFLEKRLHLAQRIVRRL